MLSPPAFACMLHFVSVLCGTSIPTSFNIFNILMILLNLVSLVFTVYSNMCIIIQLSYRLLPTLHTYKCDIQLALNCPTILSVLYEYCLLNMAVGPGQLPVIARNKYFFIIKGGLPSNDVAKERQNSMTNTAALYQLHKTNFTFSACEQTKKLNIKNIFSELLKDVGIEVPQSIETRCSMQAKVGDDSMQHAITACVT